MRDKTADIAKGIGIILMIVGHCSFCFVEYPWVIRFIYSFHMPLFFIITGLFIKEDSSFQFRKEFRRLILPYIIVSSFVILAQNGRSLIFENSFNPDVCLGAVYGSGGMVGGWKVPDNTAMWFLLCLFFGRFFFKTLVIPCKDSNKIWVVLLLMVTGYISGKYIWLPFCLCPALVAVFFIFMGYKSKGFKYTQSGLVILFLIWFSGAYLTSFDLATNYYPLLFISLIVAFSGTVIVMALSKQIARVKHVSGVLNYYGRYSLAVLCLNNIEAQLVPWYKLYDWVHIHFMLGLLVVIMRVIFVGVLLFFCKKNSLFRSIFIS